MPAANNKLKVTDNQRCEKYTSVKKGFEKLHLDYNDFLLFGTSKDFELVQISKNCTLNFRVFLYNENKGKSDGTGGKLRITANFEKSCFELS